MPEKIIAIILLISTIFGFTSGCFKPGKDATIKESKNTTTATLKDPPEVNVDIEHETTAKETIDTLEIEDLRLHLDSDDYTYLFKSEDNYSILSKKLNKAISFYALKLEEEHEINEAFVKQFIESNYAGFNDKETNYKIIEKDGRKIALIDIRLENNNFNSLLYIKDNKLIIISSETLTDANESAKDILDRIEFIV